MNANLLQCSQSTLVQRSAVHHNTSQQLCGQQTEKEHKAADEVSQSIDVTDPANAGYIDTCEVALSFYWRADSISKECYRIH